MASRKKGGYRRKSVRRKMRFLSKYGKLYSAIKRACEKEKNCSIPAQNSVQANVHNVKVKLEGSSSGQTLEQHRTSLSEPSVSGVLDGCSIKVEVPSDSEELDSYDIKLEEPSEVLEFCDVKHEVPSDSIDCGTNCNMVEKSDVNLLPTIICCAPAPARFNCASSNLQNSRVQVNKEPWMKFIRSDNQLKSATGIESFNLLRAIVGWMKVSTQNKYEADSVFMKTESRVVMTYLKLKQNLKYNFLALMFDNVTGEQCEYVFQETVTTLSKCMETIVQWSPRQSITSSRRKCLQDLKNVRVMIECIEICIDVRKKRSCRHDASQSYNDPSIARIIVGVSSKAVVTFVGRASRGNCNESSLFEESNLPQLLEEGDTVIVGDDFPIESLTKQYKFKCIKNLLRMNKTVPEKELALHRKIKVAREFVDKVHLRIKEFQILNSLPNELVVFLDQILMIISGTINLCTPVVSRDRLKPAR